MFTPIRWNGIETNLAGICVFLILLIIGARCLVGTLIQNIKNTQASIKKETALRNLHGPRIYCNDCPYCKKRLDKPFYHSSALASYVPAYCKKFRMKLPPESAMLLCQAKDPDKAMRRKPEEASNDE